jgi:hypothetical protein
MIAIAPLEWPGMNVAFLFSFFLATAMSLAIIPYAKRRPRDRPGSWGESMFGSVYAFAVMFIAFGVVPHQWIDHADKDLGWTRQKLIYGPFDILKPTSVGGAWNPINISYEALRDVIVILIHVWYFALLIVLWKVWQGRGQPKASTEVATSTYGRPLVKKA